jgi:hypothetical protein
MCFVKKMKKGKKKKEDIQYSVSVYTNTPIPVPRIRGRRKRKAADEEQRCPSFIPFLLPPCLKSDYHLVLLLSAFYTP